MTVSSLNKETGEIISGIICASCNPSINQETGEWEESNRLKPTFKIPNTYKNKRVEVSKEDKNCCYATQHRKYAILLSILTLCMVLPSVGMTVWLAMETLLHLYLHRSPDRMKRSRYRLNNLLCSEFCALCQSERSMKLIGKLQDCRTNKMRQYVKSMPIGT